MVPRDRKACVRVPRRATYCHGGLSTIQSYSIGILLSVFFWNVNAVAGECGVVAGVERRTTLYNTDAAQAVLRHRRKLRPGASLVVPSAEIRPLQQSVAHNSSKAMAYRLIREAMGLVRHLNATPKVWADMHSFVKDGLPEIKVVVMPDGNLYAIDGHHRGHVVDGMEDGGALDHPFVRVRVERNYLKEKVTIQHKRWALRAGI